MRLNGEMKTGRPLLQREKKIVFQNDGEERGEMTGGEREWRREGRMW